MSCPAAGVVNRSLIQLLEIAVAVLGSLSCLLLVRIVFLGGVGIRRIVIALNSRKTVYLKPRHRLDVNSGLYGTSELVGCLV